MAPYTAIGIFTFQDEESKKKFVEELDQLAKFVKENETDFTNAYAFYDDKDDPLKVMAFEQWTDEEGFQAHCKTEQFAKFVGVFGPMVASGKLKVEQSFASGPCCMGFLT